MITESEKFYSFLNTAIKLFLLLWIIIFFGLIINSCSEHMLK